MNSLRAIIFAIALLTVFACGGGGTLGGGGSSTVLGRVLNVETGGATNPQSQVQVGSASGVTSASDGSFQVTATNGSSTVRIDTLSSSLGVWVFNISPISATTDVGDLWVGPQRVSLTGRVLSSADNAPIANASVSFGGRSTLTNSNGTFTLSEVAYSNLTQTAFWGVIGTARATGYFKSDFSAQPNVAVAGVVNIGDILLVPASDPNPPGPPYNIWGQVSASGGAGGSIVRLKENGNDVRVFNVGSDGRYYFWIAPGNYTVVGEKGASTGTPVAVALTQPNQVVRQDIVIP